MSMRLLEQALEPQEELPANQNLCYWIVYLGAHPVCCKLLWFCFVSDKLGHPTILTPRYRVPGHSYPWQMDWTGFPSLSTGKSLTACQPE